MFDMWQAARLVHEREQRTIAALQGAQVDFALCGSNATAAWIATIDVAAVRQCRNVEILLRRADLSKAAIALAAFGFVEGTREYETRFHDGADGSRRAATEVTFAGEGVIGKSPQFRTPEISHWGLAGEKRVVRLEPLVAFQLARYRLDDAVDLRDMIDVGLVDETWLRQFPDERAARLQHPLDTPDG